MTDWFFLMVWLGGIIPAYQLCRPKRTILGSVLTVILWPMMFGEYIAANYLGDE